MFTAKDRRKCEEIYQKYYGGRKFHDTVYSELIRKHLVPGQRVLDAGCGRYLRFCRDLSGIAFYEIFAIFKVAVVLQQIYYRYEKGQTRDERFKDFGHSVVELAKVALDLAKNSGI